MTAGARVASSDSLERRFLSGTFAELCRIESPSGRERACAERVRAELGALGLSVEEDGAGPLAGSDCGNLLARISAAGSEIPASLEDSDFSAAVSSAPGSSEAST